MKVKDLLIKCSNVGLNDNVNLYTIIIDSATNEIEKIEDSVYTVLDILNDDGLSNLEVRNFELTNNSLIITITLYQSFNK
jgi:hypothetical protein